MFRAGFIAVLVTLGAMAASAVDAHAGSLYDMDALLAEPYPFAVDTNAATLASPAVQVPAVDGGSATSASGTAPMKAADSGGSTVPALSSAGSGNETGGIVSEIRTGALIHDFGPFSSRKEESYDANIEVLFSSPAFLDVIWSPRPHIGADINTAGDTSDVYLGLSYQWTFWDRYFGGFSVGGAVHNGKIKQAGNEDRKELGCRVLFRESVELGWHVARHHNLSLMLDHISNAKLCDTNEGLENFGIRYGYVF